MARIFDSHAHYDGERFDEERDALLSSLSSHGIDAVINIGSDLPSSLASVELAHRYDFIFAAVGFHPHDAAGCEAGYLDKLAALSRDPKVVAIGEIGLDYHYDFSPRDVQRRVFEEQLILARDLDLPVVIHMREATQDALDLLGRYRPRGVVHCFSSSRETAKTILSFGMYIGYTGVVTFQNARKVLGAVEDTPLDRLLLETDAPYMAPVPYRGKRCDSTMIPETAKCIAELKGETVETIIDRAFDNTCTLFGLDAKSLRKG